MILLAYSSFANASLYKCQNAEGKVVYQATACDENDVGSVLKTAPTEKIKISEDEKGQPIGSWVSPKNNKIRASLSAYGSFEMSDHQGNKLRGKWKVDKSGEYKVYNTRFQGIDMPVNIKYEAETDTLFLSKPGFSNSFYTYKRQ